MLRFFLALSIGTGAATASHAAAEACGIKIASSAPRTKALTPRSERPSRVLLLGDHSRRTATALFDAGHSVDVADRPSAARAASYQVVVTDEAHAEEARQAWPGVIIVSGEGSSQDVIERLEAKLEGNPNPRRVARRPIRELQARRPVATSSSSPRERIATGGSDQAPRAPIATGGSGQPATETVQVTASGSGPISEPDATGPVASATVTAAVEEPAVGDEPDEPRERRRAPTTRVFFRSSSSELSRGARAAVARTARWLVKHADREVTLEGHTSTIGPPEINEKLGEARAEAVKAYLIEKGVDESRIATTSFGLTRPRYKPGSNPKNRRVVIVVGR